jgi:hypothetical protein
MEISFYCGSNHHTSSKIKIVIMLKSQKDLLKSNKKASLIITRILDSEINSNPVGLI